MEQEHKRATINAMIVGSIATRGNEICDKSNSDTGNEIKRRVEFRHSTHNAYRIPR